MKPKGQRLQAQRLQAQRLQAQRLQAQHAQVLGFGMPKPAEHQILPRPHDKQLGPHCKIKRKLRCVLDLVVSWIVINCD
jgi:hypothetical protein